MDVRKLEKFTAEDIESFGFNGFETNKKYVITKEESNDDVHISIKVKELDALYRKEWSSSVESINMFNTIIRYGLSFGAYEDDRLVGVLIVSEIKWNNSLWIENIILSDKHRGYGIGDMLLDQLALLAQKMKIRIIGLEVQCLNYPAIRFYKKNGFTIDGIDMSLYPKRNHADDEIALFMKRRIISDGIL